MYNICDVRKKKEVLLNTFNKDDQIKLDKWVTKKEMREKKRGEEKVQVPVQITSKVTLYGTVEDLVKEFQSEMKISYLKNMHLILKYKTRLVTILKKI